MLRYKCVNCGAPSTALYKTYGPSVLKLSKCEKCKGIVDKYIEYDPVIIMIDLILVSKEAQRHVIYNTEFKSYWKLFVVLVMLETYGLWRNESFFNMGINTLCGVQGDDANGTRLMLPVNVQIPESWQSKCWAWLPQDRGNENDLFIWEKDFYIQFISVFTGIVIFLLTMHCSVNVLKPFVDLNKASWRQAAKSFCLGSGALMLSLSPLVWAADSPAPTRALHYALVAAYGFVVFLNVFTVLYEGPAAVTLVLLVASLCAKHYTTFQLTTLLRGLLT